MPVVDEWGDLDEPGASTLVFSVQQQAVVDAVTRTTDNLAILAAAGAGKTTVVAEAARILLARGEDVLFVTFSKEAAEEVNNLMKVSDDTKVCDRPSRTFHSLSAEELDVTWKGYITTGAPADGDHERSEVNLCIEFNSSQSKRIWSNILNSKVMKPFEVWEIDGGAEVVSLFTPEDDHQAKMLSTLTNTMARLAAVGISVGNLAQVQDWLTKNNLDVKIADWLYEYRRQVYQAGMWMYSEILIEWAGRGPGSHAVVIVDECQDLDPMLMIAARKMAEFGRLICVGDLRQTIHVWKGADPSVFQDWADLTDTRTVYMTENRRSVKSIVDLGNHVVRDYPYGNPPAVAIRADINSAGAWRIAKSSEDPVTKMMELTRTKTAPKAVGVLARTWGELARFEVAAFQQGIPYACKKRVLGRHVALRFGTKEKVLEGQAWQDHIVKVQKKQSRAADTFRMMAERASAFVSEKAFFAWVSAYYNYPKPTLLLSTAHAAKGETIDTVLLITNARWNAPAEEEAEAEHRLLFVGITRAANELTIYPDERGGVPAVVL